MPPEGGTPNVAGESYENAKKSDDRVDKVAQFVAKHFRENVEPLGYKAFLVAVDREACALYKSALDKYLPPEYSLPIYTKNAADVIIVRWSHHCRLMRLRRKRCERFSRSRITCRKF